MVSDDNLAARIRHALARKTNIEEKTMLGDISPCFLRSDTKTAIGVTDGRRLLTCRPHRVSLETIQVQGDSFLFRAAAEERLATTNFPSQGV